jgi:hypothetical protein
MKIAEARALPVGTIIRETYMCDGKLYPTSRTVEFAGVKGKEIAYKMPSGIVRLLNPLRWFPEDHPELAQARQNRAADVERQDADRARNAAFQDLYSQYGSMVVNLHGDTVTLRIPLDKLPAVAALLRDDAC